MWSARAGCFLALCAALGCGEDAPTGIDPRTSIGSSRNNSNENSNGTTNANDNDNGDSSGNTNDNASSNENANNNTANNDNENTNNNANSNSNANSNGNDDPGDSVPCVDDPVTLNATVSAAGPGDTVKLCAGVWNNLTLIVTRSGTSDAPLRVMGEGEVIVSGESEIRIEGDHVTLERLVFEGGEPQASSGVVRIFGEHVKFLDSVIDGFNGPEKKWVSLEAGSRFAEVAYNRFANKDTEGALLTVWRSDASAQNHHIHHNHFLNYASGEGANGWESIRVGTSDQSQSDSFTTIEFNLFERCDGEIEIISVKSGRNVIRGNSFVASAGLLTLRHGKANTVEDNVFLTQEVEGGGGIRVYDSDHVIRNNYIEGVRTGSNTRGGIVIHSGLNLEGGADPALNAQWTPYRVLVRDNTIFDSQQSFLYGGRRTYAARDTEFRNNVVFNDSAYPVVREDAELVSPVYDGESYWGSELGTIGESGITFSVDIGFQTTGGLMLSTNGGAQGVRVIGADEVGPRD